MCVSFFLASQRPKVLPSRFGLFWRMTKIEDMHRFQVNRCCSIICSRWLPNKFTLGSMGLVYLDTWMVDIYGECRQYRSPIDPSWVYPWNLEKIRLFRFQFELMHIFLVRKFRTNYKCFLHQELSKQLSFQIIANPHDLTPKGSWGRGAPRHIGWWNIIYLLARIMMASCSSVVLVDIECEGVDSCSITPGVFGQSSWSSWSTATFFGGPNPTTKQPKYRSENMRFWTKQTFEDPQYSKNHGQSFWSCHMISALAYKKV